jgi:hypothetical protein
MLDILEDYMVLRDYTFLRLDGSVSRAKRDMVIRMVGLAHLLAGIIGTDGCGLFSSSATIRVCFFSDSLVDVANAQVRASSVLNFYEGRWTRYVSRFLFASSCFNLGTHS